MARALVVVALCVAIGPCDPSSTAPGVHNIPPSTSSIDLVGEVGGPTAQAFAVVEADYAAYKVGDAAAWVGARMAGEFHPTAVDRIERRAELMASYRAARAADSRMTVTR